MEQLVDYQISVVHPFVEDIRAVNILYNQPIELLFDEDSVYIGLPENSFRKMDL